MKDMPGLVGRHDDLKAVDLLLCVLLSQGLPLEVWSIKSLM